MNRQTHIADFEQFEQLIADKQYDVAYELIRDLHAPDVAERLEDLTVEDAQQILDRFSAMDSAEILVELDEDFRSELLQEYSVKEIATEVIENLDSDDAADIISELPESRKRGVLSEIEDIEQAKQIADLLTHAEDTAGALMATELIKVNQNWTVLHCVKEMRRQAEEIEQVHAVYVVDDHGILLGTLSLKKLLTTSTKTPVRDLYNPKVISVKTSQADEEVARIMQKYDLVVVPVVDELGRLCGRITIDDVVDVIQEEAEKDYQLASGLTSDVEDRDSVVKLSRARLPWIMIGMIGGILSSKVIDYFGITDTPEMALFITLIAATGGNVGVQSAALVVQSLARGSEGANIKERLLKDLSVGLFTGLACSILMFGLSFALYNNMNLSLTVALSLIAVIIFAAGMGTFVPLVLNRLNVDPAVATGPFITTTNDVLGLFIYFTIGGLIFAAG
jgi:magnesium transporter